MAKIQLSAVLVASLLVFACSPVASKGTMPPPGTDGEVDAGRAPDFIAVAGRDGGIAGYVPKRYLLPVEATDDAGWPVYGADLQTLVGWMIPGKGFVPVGVDPAVVPTLPLTTAGASDALLGHDGTVAMYVRNAATGRSWFGVLAGGAFVAGQGQGYNPGLGVGCLDVPIGGQIASAIGPVGKPGVLPRAVIFTRTGEGPMAFWVDIASDGSIAHGEGVPDWWQAGPQRC